MASKLCLMSGKGGSGKTTLGITLSSLLSLCKLNVLLIDCDLATNGATYFFESKIERGKSYLTTAALFEELPECFYRIDQNEHFHFLPSRTNFQKSFELPNENFINFYNNIHTLENDYDVIIFDCQAGYSNLLKLILKISDVNLIVMELDAISSSALRVLHFQTAELLEAKKTYQVFNKITEEEEKLYKDISIGTLFTSLPPIGFNWEIRRAFAFSQIPKLESDDRSLGEYILKIAEIIFPEHQLQLTYFDTYSATIELEEMKKKRNNSSNYFQIALKTFPTKNEAFIFSSIVILIIGILLLIAFIFALPSLSILLLLLSIGSIFTSVFLISRQLTKETKHFKEQYESYDQKVKDLENIIDNRNKLIK